MFSEIKLVITHNDKVIQTVTKELCELGFVKSLESFQVIANSTMTKLIEDSGDSGDCKFEEEPDDSDNEEEEQVCVTPKKKKK